MEKVMRLLELKSGNSSSLPWEGSIEGLIVLAVYHVYIENGVFPIIYFDKETWENLKIILFPWVLSLINHGMRLFPIYT